MIHPPLRPHSTDTYKYTSYHLTYTVKPDSPSNNPPLSAIKPLRLWGLRKSPVQPFHLVEISPWPLFAALGALFLTLGMVGCFYLPVSSRVNPYHLLKIGYLITPLIIYQWWRDVTLESTFQGFHSKYVVNGLKLGIILFILSEVCFFFGFFWAFYHSRLAPSPELGCIWPPTHISALNPFAVPLLNTVVLLFSGATITWAHNNFFKPLNDLNKNWKTGVAVPLFFTACLGIYFRYLQLGEYSDAPFTIADGVYGSTFFVATGFHGLHVLIGTTFLWISLYRLISNHLSLTHHFGFEAAAWYWHFVDVIWIFLFLSIYWWGS